MPDDFEKMKVHFEKRTKHHIALTQKYCKRIADRLKGFDGIIARGEVHDQSKWGVHELDPYIWLTWRYKCQDDGVKCNLPKGMENKINKATKHHIMTNSHHAEYHVPPGHFAGIDEKDRDKSPGKLVDATAMPDLDVAEMVADWCAMAEERGNTPRAWANQKIGVRWKFTPEQEKLIYKIIKEIW